MSRRLANGLAWVLLGGGLALPAMHAVRAGYLADSVARYVARALVVADRPRLEMLGFDLMPLPTLLLGLWPSALGAAVLSGMALGGVSLYAGRGGTGLQAGRWLRVGIVAGVLVTPVTMLLTVAHPDEAIGLALLYAAGRQYHLWVQTGVNVRGFQTGLLLAVACFAVPVALPFAGLLAVHQFRTRPTPEEGRAAALVVVFPAAAAALGGLFLSWMFGGDQAPVPVVVPEAVPTAAMYGAGLVLPVLFMVLLLRRRGRGFSLVVLPAVAMAVGTILGWRPSPAFAAAWLAFASTDRAAALGRRSASALAGVVGVQTVALWMLLPLPAPTPVDRAAASVAARLRILAPGTILTDDRVAYRLLARAETTRPFLLPGERGYGLAMTTPRRYVRHVMACPGPTPLGLQFGDGAPLGFTLAWAFDGCRFYTRTPMKNRASTSLP